MKMIPALPLVLLLAVPAASLDAIQITGLDPAAAKVRARQPVVLTLEATDIPPTDSAGNPPPMCFLSVDAGDPSVKYPADWTTDFVSGRAALQALTYPRAGTYKVTVAGKTPVFRDPLQWSMVEVLIQRGVKPCTGSATATLTVWDPAAEPGRRIHTTVATPPPNLPNGPVKPGVGPVSGRGGAFIAAGDAFDVNVTLREAVLGDGSVRFSPGTYRVHVVSLGDGAVRATFFLGGQEVGHAGGRVALNEERLRTFTGPLTFSRVGLTGNGGRTELRVEGTSVKLEIASTDGGHAVLIGLTPAPPQAGRAPAPRLH